MRSGWANPPKFPDLDPPKFPDPTGSFRDFMLALIRDAAEEDSETCLDPNSTTRKLLDLLGRTGDAIHNGDLPRPALNERGNRQQRRSSFGPA